LDIGCNTGRLLKEETGRLNCHGVEINKKAAKIAESAGIKMVAERVEEGVLDDNKYDVITSVDVFEHLNDPLLFIDRLVMALKPQGKLYIFTGRTDCLPSYICGSYYWYFKPAQHLIFLNNKFIKWFGKNNRQLDVSTVSMNHFYSSLRAQVYQISWLIAWRLFSPNSPYKIFPIKRLNKMKEPFMVTAWKDHVFFIVQKKISSK
jgi:2-polyprenyl-3-methyl-5-hydroxy-6-metoxy-1,4-benzoquinol methylase